MKTEELEKLIKAYNKKKYKETHISESAYVLYFSNSYSENEKDRFERAILNDIKEWLDIENGIRIRLLFSEFRIYTDNGNSFYTHHSFIRHVEDKEALFEALNYIIKNNLI